MYQNETVFFCFSCREFTEKYTGQFAWGAVLLHFEPPPDFEYQKCKFEIPMEMEILNTLVGLVF